MTVARRPPTVWFTVRGFPIHIPRKPRRFFEEMSGGEALFPLIVLVGLNCVNQLDQTAFGVLGPDIEKSFNLSNQGYLALVALTQLGGLLLAVPLAYFSDRLRRVMIAVVGAAVWCVFGVFTGLSVTVLMLVVARSGAGMGRAVITPSHNSLLSDYYPPEVRTDVFGFHAIGLAIGAFIGPVVGGLLAHYYGWRLPFFVFAIPTIVFVILGMWLHEPGRGHWERAAAGANAQVIGTDEVPPSFAESIRILWQVGTLRRIWYSLPFLAASFIGLITLTSLYYEQVFHLGDFQRGVVAACAEPAQIVAILLGIPLAARLMLRDPGLGMRMLAVVGTLIAACWIVFALAPNLGIAIAMNIAVSGLSSLLVPGIFAALSLTIPPKVRAMGFSMAALFIVPGLLALYVVGGIADAYGIRAGLLIVAPIFLIGAWILASGSVYVRSDINRVWTSTAAQAEVMFKRQQGEVKLLLVRNVDVHYDSVQVLFTVNFEVDEGEIVALLGTNGAGKSTLLKTICGLVEATNGAVVFDGRDMTYAPPNEVAGRGVVMMPGGQGTFPSLTVAEHLRLASWLHRKDKARVEAASEHVLELFPVLRSRLDQPAGNLSGGQQQMLALGMAFIQNPRLLMIDELSLGLAPTIVEQLLPLVRDIAAQGTTVILVEQSVNLALTIAETAYFMEKGEIRFHGPTAELLERPDVLRSVFLEGAQTVTAPAPARNGATNGDMQPVELPAVELPPIEIPRIETKRSDVAPVETTVTNGHADLDATGPAIRLGISGVSKRFGGLAALTGVTFDATGGEIVGFLGPNGAGKTTLFDTISGFTTVDEGRILVGEGGEAHDVTSMPPALRSRLGLGRSFQDGRLFPSLTVAETVALSFERHLEVRDPVGAALHLPFATEAETNVEARVEELLELLGITDFRDKLGRELSTGSRRIVDIACVLAHRPSVLLLDEPSSGIAQRESEALGPLLLRIREETGATLLVIEHDVPLLLSVADRLIALDLGQIVCVGSPDAVVRDPAVVKSYLGTTDAVIARSGSRRARLSRHRNQGGTVATQQTPKPPKSALARYAPVIAIVVVVAIVAVVIGILTGGKSSKDNKAVSTNTTAGTGPPTFKDVPIFYNEAKASGTVDKYTWPSTCDTTTGLVKIPILNPPPCVPEVAAAKNGGATSPGVTADTIKIGYYTAKPDPTYDPILKAAGAYDSPEASAKAYQDYFQIYAHQYELSGRKVELVHLAGSGASTDEVAAKADADKAASEGVFAVVGGPAQAVSFQTELAAKKILCLGQCVASAPQKFVADNSPYIWPTGPNPEQTAIMTTDFIKNQLLGKDAVYGGADVKSKPRTFALLSYDTPDGEYKDSWDTFYSDLKAAGVPVVGHVSYFLNPASLAADGRTVATKLKSTGATSIIFTGDPIFPSYLTPDMTQQGYFPEWVMAGTVLADTNVFARKFDQQQWSHAFGLQLIPARVPKPNQDSYTLHQWWFGTPPPTQNNFSLIKGDAEIVMDGIHLAGPNLTPQTFLHGMQHMPPAKSGPNELNSIVTYGDHGYWSGTDYGGLDNAGILYWDPKTVGPDETGAVGAGMYRLVDGGRRYLPNQWPTTPVKLFDPAGTVTIYASDAIPPELKPASVPVPPGAPAFKG